MAARAAIANTSSQKVTLPAGAIITRTSHQQGQRFGRASNRKSWVVNSLYRQILLLRQPQLSWKLERLGESERHRDCGENYSEDVQSREYAPDPDCARGGLRSWRTVAWFLPGDVCASRNHKDRRYLLLNFQKRLPAVFLAREPG